ncbi:MAG: alpha-D-ribose 1-methylphosphonate 5-triphosphate diphosphatase, partial [Paenibacillus sp.]|nr:alpha-D-ribose 1-methylphosphonate 5-triphosphate diphosphatase [Paenibacillus sp.]
NVMLGRSHSNNLSAREAIDAGVVDMLCSDYYPPAMLQAVFSLHRQGMGLPEAVNLVSLGPAKALGIDRDYGSIAPGKAADLLLVRAEEGRPVIETVLVGGHPVCRMAYRHAETAWDGKGAERVEV